MQIFGTILCLIFGLILIVKGGDIFVGAAGFIAEVSGIPKFIVGATVVSLATTLPELLVSLIAASKGQNEMAVGNAVGSVTANIGFILAIAFVLMRGDFKRRDYLVKSLLLISAAVVTLISGIISSVNLAISIALLIIFVIFIWDNIKSGLAAKTPTDLTSVSRAAILRNIASFILGAAGITLGAELLVDNGKTLAVNILGVSEKVVAVSIIALGTSLPELATTLTAICKKQFSLTAGNIIGANILDLTLILPLCSLASGKPLPVNSDFARLDLIVCLVLICTALLPTLIKEKTSKATGGILLIVYIIYIILALG